ncbi:collagen-binding domain-containing protein [Sphingomonas sp. MMS24-J13]|uniref:collagen-binding domain-containing protein n=1 Tax=Sphingomonas sp. MMS24-J13 TaxID=3238686 RepID=UPI00384B5FF3
MKKSSLLITVGAAILACAPAHAVTNVVQALNDMRALNLITLGDYNGGGHDVEGKAWVGGNLKNGTTIGFGHSANPSQSAVTSSYSTLTVLGSASGNINLDTGPGVGGNYGATIVGNLEQININGTNGTIKVGGSLTGSSTNITSGTTMTVRGNAAGANISSGASLVVGGSLGNFNASGGSTVSMGSYSGGNKVAVSSGSSVYVGSSINQAENNGGTLQVTGNIGDMQGYGQNSVTKVSGSIGGNGNGIGNSPSYIYAGGSIAGSQNANGNAANVHANYTFDSTVTAPTTLGTPAVPTVMPLSTMTANMQALSTALLAQSSTHATTSISYFNDGHGLMLNATETGTNGVAVFNLDQSALTNFTGISYNFSDPNLIVIVNILNSNGTIASAHSGSYDWNMTWNTIAGAAKSYDQQIIWNFADANTLNFNREEWGSVLAPYATVSNGGGNINGSLVAKVFNQSSEVHLGTFDGFTSFLAPVSSPAPEPATWAMMLSGFGAVGTMIRRRRRQGDLARAA